METNPITVPDSNAEMRQMVEEMRGYEKKNLRINRIRMI